MATTARRLTYDDLLEIPQERVNDRHELIDGELVVTPAPVPWHQIVSRALFRAIDNHVSVRQLGLVLFAPVDVRLTPDTVLEPDIIFIARDRLHIIGPKTVDAAPDLVVEVLSPGTRRRDLEVKRGIYARFGVQEYWVADPDASSLTILALQKDQFAALDSDEDGILSSRVLPGLKVALDDVFSSIIDR